MQAVICVNGLINSYTGVRALLEQADLHIAADGGLRHFHAVGMQPHALVGDLDSVEPGTLEALSAAGVAIQRFRPEKAQTDLELAIEYALAAGATEIVLIGAVGGRLDQTLANLLLLAQREWPAALTVVEANQVAHVVRGGQTLSITGTPGAVVSLIPLTAQVTGITYTGLRYPLTDATLAFGSTRGISNELAAPQATIQLSSGMALVVQEIDMPGTTPQ